MRALLVVVMLATANGLLHGQSGKRCQLDKVNRALAGVIVDHTNNHGRDRAIPSQILCDRRDLYVYLPPGFDPNGSYPVLLWLHGACSSERTFLRSGQIDYLDRLIREGCCPPVVVASPDGTLPRCGLSPAYHTFFLNGDGGAFRDHLLHEVLPFLARRYSVDLDGGGNAILGSSAGGMGAMAIGLEHPETFGFVMALSAPLNLRYWNSHDRYFADFDPETFRWKDRYEPNLRIGRFAGGLIGLRAKGFIRPVFGRGQQVVGRISEVNPVEIVLRQGPNVPRLFVHYAGRDNFNFDAQSQSFAWLAEQAGVKPTVVVSPRARHDDAYFDQAVRAAYDWLASELSALRDRSADEILSPMESPH